MTAQQENRMTVQQESSRAGSVPECHGDVCITCSDTAVAVRIVRLLDDGLAIADTGQGQEEISVALVTAGVGDTILVHAGEAIAVVQSEREGCGGAWAEEQRSLRPSDEGRHRLEAPRRRAGDAGR
jgi:hydrogenase expression/formation protein HypC